MRAAPAVSVAVRAGARWRLAVALLLAVAGAAVLLWAAERGDAPAWLGAGACMGWAAVLGWRGGRVARWRLDWDGQAWQLQAERERAPHRGKMAVMLDLGDALLLRFVPDDGTRGTWLPLQRADAPAEWHALRCALYSPRPAAAGEAA
ncbi:MAG TPA: hypothetical protein VLI72_01625 [Methylibium sp.]|nr:hypothetical protein [Methylibium sp.]